MGRGQNIPNLGINTTWNYRIPGSALITRNGNSKKVISLFIAVAILLLNKCKMGFKYTLDAKIELLKY